MLDIIKILLDIDDDSSDDKILYHIDAVTKNVLKYCGLEILPDELKDIVVQIVVLRMDDKKGGTVVEKIDVGVWSQTVTKNPASDELSPHKVFLNKFRKVKFI